MIVKLNLVLILLKIFYSDSLELLSSSSTVPNSTKPYRTCKNVIFQTQYQTPYFEKFLICLIVSNSSNVIFFLCLMFVYVDANIKLYLKT